LAHFGDTGIYYGVETYEAVVVPCRHLEGSAATCGVRMIMGRIAFSC